MPGVPPARYAFPGPHGSSIEAALRTLPAARSADLQAQPTARAALDAVRNGEADGAFLLIETVDGGSDGETLDALSYGDPVVITREVLGPNGTRFVLVSRPGLPLPPTGDDKTSLVIFGVQGKPGALRAILDEFALRGVDVTRLDPRPTGQALGRYWFSFDVEGHVADARLGEALMGLRRLGVDMRFLGSYPRDRYDKATVRPGTTEAGRGDQGRTDVDFLDAERWLGRLRDGRI
ncbi:prephenate dehydratase [Kribbella deserti]|uniref:Prephenate dehydratase n=1 Tax=Kribbella deserti TaxID=1926257 RepID=A0ABV6QVK0_9ACTN